MIENSKNVMFHRVERFVFVSENKLIVAIDIREYEISMIGAHLRSYPIK